MSPGTRQCARAGRAARVRSPIRRPAAGAARRAVQVDVARLPDELVADARLGGDRELRAAVVRLEVLGVHAHGQRARPAQIGRCCSIPLPMCTSPSTRERERALGHDPHRQREREHVRVRRRQPVHRARSRRRRCSRTRWSRSIATSRTSSSVSGSSSPRRRGRARLPQQRHRHRARVERGQARRRGELATAHAPIRLWPQTRTTLPLTPPDAGLASQRDRLGDVDRQAALGDASSSAGPPRACRPASRRSSSSR